jgi:hypothetical protein
MTVWEVYDEIALPAHLKPKMKSSSWIDSSHCIVSI